MVSSLASRFDVLFLEIVHRLKVVIFLLAAFNVFMIGLAGYSAVVWGFNALVVVFCFGFIVNASVFWLSLRGKGFSDEVLLDERIG